MEARNRVKVTVSPAMRVALEILAARSNLPVATQAMVTLRAALDRTIQSAEGQAALRETQAFLTRDGWLDGMQVTHEVETAYDKVQEEGHNAL